MAYYHSVRYSQHEADSFIANNNSNEVIYRGNYFSRPNNLEMLGRIMPEFAEVLVEAYNHTPDELARAVISCSYCCDQIARGELAPREAWQHAYISARYLHRLAADIVSDGFIYDASTDRAIANNHGSNYGYTSYGFVAHTFRAIGSKRWIEVLYKTPRKVYESERRERIYLEGCMRSTHMHYNKPCF